MFTLYKKLRNPALFQGSLNKKHYFEGWYFKLVDAQADNLYALIPGVSLATTEDSHAFIQVINGKTSETHYLTFDLDQFSYSSSDFSISIAGNHFSQEGLALSLEQDGLSLHGRIQFGEFHPWPVTILSPGVMGWYAYVPFMECYHGVLSFDHALHGQMENNGKVISFEGGRGYIEKDWGTSFPGYYIWIQSNHFGESNVSLMASVANIPWLGTAFDGFIIGLVHQKRLYRFATYTGAKIIKLKTGSDRAIVHVSDGKFRIEMDVHRTSEGGELKAPRTGAMEQHIRECMTSVITVSLFALQGKREELIYHGESAHTGFEMGGAVEKMQNIG